jgi:hypothetical protein
MAISLVLLNLKIQDNISEVDARVSTSIGGIISLIPVLAGFLWGTYRIIWSEVQSDKIAGALSH